ncbi:MAG: aminopeptidase P family protein [Ruminococcaceae bacterium]|nr:aminopeptidase P family protein [Oscillospiraceae bacterium]
MFEENLKGILSALKDAPYGAVLLTSPQNRFYVTGFHSSAGIALISKDRAVFATDFRYFEDAGAKIQGFELVMTKSGLSYTDIINRFCAEEGVTELAFEADAMSYAGYQAYSAKLTAKLVPEDGLMARLRHIKHDFELERIEKAQRIAEAAFDKILTAIRPGIRECDIAAELDYQMRLFGATANSFDTIVVSGENGSLCHGVPGERVIQNGDFITMDFGALWGGYCSDMTRTVAVGHVSDEQRKVYDTVLRAQTESLAAAKAGIIGADLHKVAADIIEGAGYGEYFGHSLGHSLGIDVHDGLGAQPTNMEPLQEGVVVTIEPGIYLPGKFGVRIEDFVVLTKDGCRNFMKAPKELIIL